MKKFFSEKLLSGSDDGLFATLIDLIESKYVLDKTRILNDISIREKLINKSGIKCKPHVYGKVNLHAARTDGIKTFCLSCAQKTDGNIEVLVLWNEFSEQILDKLSILAIFFEKATSMKFSYEYIVNRLKNL